MASSINALTSSGGGVVTTADASGVLNLQSNGTTIAAISSTGVAVTGDVSSTNGTLYPLVSGTAKAYNWNGLTTNTFLDVTGIPSWVKRITFQLIGVSWATGGTAPMIQLGTSGGIVTTGYSSAGQLGNTNVNATSTGLVFSATDSTSATRFWWGTGVLTLADAATNSWTWTSSVSETLAGAGGFGGGAGGIALGGTLTQIRFLTVATTDVLDAGSINVLYE